MENQKHLRAILFMCYHNCDMIPQQNENNNGTVPRGDSEDLSKKNKKKHGNYQACVPDLKFLSSKMLR